MAVALHKPLSLVATAKYQLQMLGSLCLVWFVWALTPISWGVTFYAAFRIGVQGVDWQSILLPEMPRVTSLPTLWAHLGWNIVRIYMWLSICEVPFSIYLYVLTQRAARIRQPPAFKTVELETLLINCLEVGLQRIPLGARTRWIGKARPLKTISSAFDQHHLSADATASIRLRLMQWFHNANVGAIRAGNMREWLAWAFLGRELQDCEDNADACALLESALGLIEKRCNWKFPTGYNTDIRSIRLTLDPLQASHRPLAAYIVCNGFTYGTIAWACFSGGFQLQTHGELRFMVRQADKSAKEPTLPVVFLHGLGIGIGQYFLFLRQLRHHTGGVVIMLQPNISGFVLSRHFLDAPSEDSQVEALRTAMHANGFGGGATLVSHSNGTMLHGWILRRAPELVRRSVLIDPVSFRLFEGALCYNFLHRPARTPIAVLLRYFVAQELSVAHAICRLFIWPSMALWVPEFPSIDKESVHFLFAQNDILVDVAGSVAYLRDEGVPDEAITIMPNYQHGQALCLAGEGMRIACKYAHIPFQ